MLALVAWLLLLWLDYESPRFYINFFSQGTFFVVAGAVGYAALRLRGQDAPRPVQMRRAALFALALAGVLTATFGLAVLCAASIFGTYSTTFDFIRNQFPYLPIVVALAGPIFLACRLALRLWRFWDQLQRRHLLWSITHAHLLMVVGLSFLFTLIPTLIYGGATISNDITLNGPLVKIGAGLMAELLPVLALLTVATAVVLVIVLPPSALLSYIIARRTTRRLAQLTAGTLAIRAGDYAARVAVQGEDEVAQLQASFNAMSDDLQAAMRDLRAERDTVAALLQSRRELVAGVSHELRTPVATLRGYIESTLADRAGMVPLDLRHDLTIMEREVVRLQRLIDDLFTVSRAEAGHLPLRMAATDVGKLAQRLVDTAAPLVWQSSKVQVVAEVPSGLPPACVDSGRLEQILSNLLHNAVRHTPAGGLVGVLLAAEPDAVVLRVQDTGEGIGPADLPRIWERFYRAGGAAQPGEGSGLGLALVKELTDAMGGTVAVASTFGEGSCFTIRLPRA